MTVKFHKLNTILGDVKTEFLQVNQLSASLDDADQAAKIENFQLDVAHQWDARVIKKCFFKKSLDIAAEMIAR